MQLAFYSGLGGAIYVQIFGTFAVAEIFLVFISVVAILYFGKLPRNLNFLLLFTVLWVVGILVSDLYNKAQISNTIKLVGSVSLFYIDILAFYIIFRKNIKLVPYFLAGSSISYLLQFYVFPPPLAAEMFGRDFSEIEVVMLTWVALTHYVAMMAVSGILWYFSYRRISLILNLIAAVGALYLGSRAYFLVGMISLAILLFTHYILLRRGSSPERRVGFSQLLILFVVIIFSIFLATLIYQEAAKNDILGDYAYNKFSEQANVEGLGLASGRLDFFESLYSVAQRPILGYGSYAIDDLGVQTDFYKLIGANGKESKELIPCHSHILGAWVWSGILSLPFWLFAFWHIGRNLFYNYDERFIGVIIPYSIFIFWHMLFSPIGYRVDLAFLIGLIFALRQPRLLDT